MTTQQSRAIQFAEDAHDAAGAMHILHVVLGRARRDLAQLRHLARQAIDIRQREIQLRLLRRGQRQARSEEDDGGHRTLAARARAPGT